MALKRNKSYYYRGINWSLSYLSLNFVSLFAERLNICVKLLVRIFYAIYFNRDLLRQ